MKHNKLSQSLINLGLVIATFLVLLLFLETILQFTPYRHLLYRDRFIMDYYQADPAKGFDIRPNVGKIRTWVDPHSGEFDIWSNELSCFDEPYRGEKDFILLLGDSLTHAFAPFKDKWGTRIERLLNYRVLKCGVSAYGTKEELLKAREIIARIHRSPRLIMVGYFWNDLATDYLFPYMTVVDGILVTADKYKEIKQTVGAAPGKKYSFWEKLTVPYPLRSREVIKYYLLKNLVLANLLQEALLRFFPPKTYISEELWLHNLDQSPWFEQAWLRHQENLKAFKELATTQGAELLLVVIPTNVQVYPFLTGGKKIDLDRPNRILEKFLRQERIKYLDLLPFFQKYADQTPRQSLSSEKDLYWQANPH